MKTSLEPQQVQSWSLLGMKPMHRALLRRTVVQASIPLTDPAASRFELIWHDLAANQSGSDCFYRPGVLIIDSDTLTKRIEDREGSEFNLDMYYHKPNAQIRLLWNWGKRGKEDLMWCSEFSFDGVLYDLASMNRWVRVCLKRGRIIQSQNNFLLRDLTLPTISPRSSLV